MDACGSGGTPINSFGLVAYLSGALAEFAERLRRELAPTCSGRAHVTVLPPRALACDPDQAWRQIVSGLTSFAPFTVELGEVKVFSASDVVYLSLGTGCIEFQSLHRTLNNGLVQCVEPFEYHPHLTLAQCLTPGRIAAAAELAASSWPDYRGERGFTVDRLTWVQNTLENRWRDLDAYSLSAKSVCSVPEVTTPSPVSSPA